MFSYFSSSSTPAPTTPEDQQRLLRRLEYIKTGRAHNQSRRQADDATSWPSSENHGDGGSSSRSSHASARDLQIALHLQRPPVTWVDGQAVVTRQDLVHGASTVPELETTLQALGNVAGDESYAQGVRPSFLQKNIYCPPRVVLNKLPSGVQGFYEQAPSPAADAIDLFTGQTIEFCRLVQLTSYHVLDGLGVCELAIEALSLVLDTGKFCKASVLRTCEELRTHIADSLDHIAQLELLLSDLDDARDTMIDVLNAENVDARKGLDVWRGILVVGGSFFGLAATALAVAEVYSLSSHGSISGQDVVNVAGKVLSVAGWSTTATDYQLKENDQDAKKSKADGKLLATTTTSLVQIRHAVKHHTQSFHILTRHINLPFFDGRDSGDPYIVLDKWKATRLLFQISREQVQKISDVMMAHRVPLPVHPRLLQRLARSSNEMPPGQ